MQSLSKIQSRNRILTLNLKSASPVMGSNIIDSITFFCLGVLRIYSQAAWLIDFGNVTVEKFDFFVVHILIPRYFVVAGIDTNVVLHFVSVTTCNYSLSLRVMSSPSEVRYLKEFGARFAEIRRTRGLTQEQLAEMADITTLSVSFIEQGRRWPRLATLHKLAKCLGVSPSDFLK